MELEKITSLLVTFTTYLTRKKCVSSNMDSDSAINLKLLHFSKSHLILCHSLLLLPPIPPSIRVFSNESTLHMRWPKYWRFSFTSVLPKNTQDWSPLEWTGCISLQSKGLYQKSSPTPHFKSINFSVLSFLHSPTVTSIHPLEKP